MKTIAIFTSYYINHLGGVERYVHNLAKFLYKRGYKVIIVTTEDSKDIKEELDYATIYYIRTWKLFRNRYPILKLRHSKKVLKELKEHKIDCVIANCSFYLMTLFGTKFANKNNITSYVIQHTCQHVTLNNKFIDFFAQNCEHYITNKVKKYTDAFFCVSKASSNWQKHFNIQAKDVWYTSINSRDCEKEIKENNNNFKILYAGRLVEEKGILILLKAFEKLKNEYPKIELIVAGDGYLLKKIKNGYSNVIFLGKISHKEIMKLYGKVDVFVNPSIYQESITTTILEAGLMKCFVITTNTGGTGEIIEHEKNGLSCNPNAEEIYLTLKNVIEKKYEIEKMKLELHKKVKEKFNWETNIRKIEKYL